jgi:hypothetical protein
MERPILVINPRDDGPFVELAERLVGDGVADLDDLQERLAVDYPAVTVHRRELSGEPLEVWYVYRDGHWLSGRWQ